MKGYELWVKLNLFNIKDIYEISDHGNIRNIKTKKILKGHINEKGRIQVMLQTQNTKIKKYYLHRLVALTFLEYRNEKDFETVNHKNGNKLDNSIFNLEFLSIENNNEHARVTGLIHNCDKCHNASLNNELVHKICQYFENGKSYEEIIKKINLENSKKMNETLKRIKQKISWTHISKYYRWNPFIKNNGNINVKLMNKVHLFKSFINENKSFEDICKIHKIKNSSNNRDLFRNIKNKLAFID